MILAEQSDLVQIATMFFSMLSTIVLAFISYLTMKLNKGQTNGLERLHRLEEKIDEVHTLAMKGKP